MLRTVFICLLSGLAIAAAGCGDDDETADTGTEPTATQTERAEGAETTGEDPGEAEGPEDDGGDAATKPVGEADVTLTEFKVALLKRALPKQGVYRLNIVNEGDTTHALEAEGPNGETETDEIEPGGSATLDAYLVSGTYKLYCPIGNHEQRGMTARLRVLR